LEYPPRNLVSLGQTPRFHAEGPGRNECLNPWRPAVLDNAAGAKPISLHFSEHLGAGSMRQIEESETRQVLASRPITSNRVLRGLRASFDQDLPAEIVETVI
jgi:hypothetical protein